MSMTVWELAWDKVVFVKKDDHGAVGAAAVHKVKAIIKKSSIWYDLYYFSCEKVTNTDFLHDI